MPSIPESSSYEYDRVRSFINTELHEDQILKLTRRNAIEFFSCLNNFLMYRNPTIVGNGH